MFHHKHGGIILKCYYIRIGIQMNILNIQENVGNWADLIELQKTLFKTIYPLK